MKPPVLLCYNLQGDQAAKVKLTAMRFKIRIRVVHPEEYHQTLAALCDMEPPVDAPFAGEAFADEMLVMAHFPAGMASQFVSALHRAKIPPIPLKAILTETNAAWDSVTLHQQIAEEHAAITGGQGPVHQGSKE